MTKDIQIVSVNDQESLNKCFDIRTEVFVVEQQVPPDEELDSNDALECVLCGDICHILGIVGGEPACTLRMRFLVNENNHRIAKYERMAVRKQFRSHGFGRDLMTYMTNVAYSRGCHKGILCAQLHAIPFYSKLGFGAEGDVFLDANIEHRKMHRDLFCEYDNKALLLDCDGVLVDSEPFSCTAWNVLFKRRYNYDVGSDYSMILGTTSLFSAEYYCKLVCIPYDNALLTQIAKDKEDVYFELASGKLKSKPGVRELIDRARSMGYRIAVASSGAHHKVVWSLNEAGLPLELFDKIVGGDGKRGKPNPDIFIAAASSVQSSLSKCVVVEDTTAGVRAARSSGMSVHALLGTMDGKDLLDAGATSVVDSLIDVPL